MSNYHLFLKKELTKQVLIVGMGTKSLRHLREGAVYNEGGKTTDQRLVLKPSVTNISLVNSLLCRKYHTWHKDNMAYTFQNNNESQNNMLKALDKN